MRIFFFNHNTSYDKVILSSCPNIPPNISLFSTVKLNKVYFIQDEITSVDNLRLLQANILWMSFDNLK